MQLIEHYLSIQGEGLHTGKLTYFVRFARCNLSCQWCDSAYTFGKGTKFDFSAVTQAIVESSAPFVCLTGGEPLLYPQECVRLIQHFPQLHFDIETGGHVFQLVFSNNQQMNDVSAFTQTTGNWDGGKLYFGFNMYRVF